MRPGIALLAATVATSVLCVAAPPLTAESLRIDVRSAEGDGVHLTVGTGLVSGLVRALAPASIDCDEDRSDDPKVRELFRALDRAGEPSRGTLRQGDESFDARREDGKLILKMTGDDGEVVNLTLPWTIARCVLGGERISGRELARAFDSGEFLIHVVDGEEVVRVEID